jgi:hypothetical protein
MKRPICISCGKKLGIIVSLLGWHNEYHPTCSAECNKRTYTMQAYHSQSACARREKQ